MSIPELSAPNLREPISGSTVHLSKECSLRRAWPLSRGPAGPTATGAARTACSSLLPRPAPRGAVSAPAPLRQRPGMNARSTPRFGVATFGGDGQAGGASPVGPPGPTRDHPAPAVSTPSSALGRGLRVRRRGAWGRAAGPWPWLCAGAVLGRRWPRRSASCHRGERCRRRSPRGPRAADSARGATTCSSGRNRWASPARRQRWRPEDHAGTTAIGG